MNIEELILKYATLMPVRYNFKQKYLFINEISKEYQILGYKTNAVADKKKGQRSLNLMIGDFKKCNTIILSNYDTPSLAVGRGVKYDPFNGTTSFANSFFSSYTPLLLGSILLLAIYLFGFPKVDFENKFLYSISIVLLSIIVLIATWMFTRGIANKSNYNRNSSGVIANLMLADKLKECKNIVYILTDMGCSNHKGDKMLQTALPNTLKDKQVIILDCVGSDGRISAAYRGNKNLAATFIDNTKETKTYLKKLEEEDVRYSSANYYQKCTIISSGKKQNEMLLVEKTCTNEDNNINIDNLSKIVEALAKTLKNN